MDLNGDLYGLVIFSGKFDSEYLMLKKNPPKVAIQD